MWVRLGRFVRTRVEYLGQCNDDPLMELGYTVKNNTSGWYWLCACFETKVQDKSGLFMKAKVIAIALHLKAYIQQCATEIDRNIHDMESFEITSFLCTHVFIKINNN